MSGASVAAKAHAELGASNASRWLACPGSIRLSREVPVPPTTSFAQEGTQAHAVAELCLTRNVAPDFFVGMEVEGAIVTDEMAEHVRVYVDHCRDVMSFASEYWVERKFNLGALNPPGPMFGTADFVAYEAEDKILAIVDLKYGQGVLVEAKNNPQLRYYALGAVLSMQPRTAYPIAKVVMQIVQPRALHPDGVIREEVITYGELMEFGRELLAGARKALSDDAPLNPGEKQCRFCPASGVCPAQRDHAQSLAQMEFSIESVASVPAPSTLTDEQLGAMLPVLSMVEDYIRGVRAQAAARLENGQEVPGYKLVSRRPSRVWTDESAVEQIMRASGFTDRELFHQDLKSPAQLERLLGKKAFQAMLASLTEKQSSGHKMVPASDPAPAITLSRGEEFALLMSGDDVPPHGKTDETNL